MIKFRAWDKTRKKMFCYKNQCGIKQLNFTQDMSIESVELFEYLPNQSFAFKTLEINDVELMQYTGLKDKNDVEIYEGDILKYPYVRSSSVNYTIEIGAIEWSDEYCGFIIDEVQNIGGFCGIESKHMNELEVIGNIYENPKLLN